MDRKLLIISDTPLFKDNNSYFGFVPVVKEIEFIDSLFKEIVWIGYDHIDRKGDLSMVKITSSKIKVILLKKVGGKNLMSFLKILVNYPIMGYIIFRHIQKSRIIHLRAPSHPAIIASLFSFGFRRKLWWKKFAGNWAQTNPPTSYGFQRSLFKKAKFAKVTINGSWPNQPAHCLTFENPCLTEADRVEGVQIIQNKNYSGPFVFCFVGRLEDAKGVQRIIDAFSQLEDKSKVATLHFVGSGPNLEQYKKQAEQIPAVFHGALSREDVFDIYKKSHFFLLPSSASEGFPKVIAEAMNFGAIPIVSSVSSIGQYINEKNGFVLPNCTSVDLITIIENIENVNNKKLKEEAFIGYETASLFTFERYRERILNEVLKD